MQSQTGVWEDTVSTPRAPSTVCVRQASSPPQRVGNVRVRSPGGSGQGSAHVCPPLPLPGPQLPGTRICSLQKAEHFPQGNHAMENMFIERLLTPGISTDDKMKTIMSLVLAEHTI